MGVEENGAGTLSVTLDEADPDEEDPGPAESWKGGDDAFSGVPGGKEIATAEERLGVVEDAQNVLGGSALANPGARLREENVPFFQADYRATDKGRVKRGRLTRGKVKKGGRTVPIVTKNGFGNGLACKPEQIRLRVDLRGLDRPEGGVLEAVIAGDKESAAHFRQVRNAAGDRKSGSILRQTTDRTGQTVEGERGPQSAFGTDGPADVGGDGLLE